MNSIENIINNWNASMPTYPITLDDLQKPTPIFFIEAILKLLHSFDIQTDAILRTKHPHNVDIADLSEEHFVLGCLAGIVNLLLGDMDQPENNWINLNITMFDLLMPTPSIVQTCIGLLHNFGIYINQRWLELSERETEIEEFFQKMNINTIEEDQFKIEIDHKHMEKSQIERCIHQKEEDIKMLKKSILAPENEVSELKTQFDMIQVERESIQADFLHKQTLHTTLEEKMLKEKANILTENEQAEINDLRESAIQRDIEIKVKEEAIGKKLMKLDADINTLKAVELNSSECRALLDSLEEVCAKIKEVQNLNSTPYEEMKSLRHLKEYETSMIQKYTEYEIIEKQLVQELEQINFETKNEFENNLIEENAIQKKTALNDIAIKNSHKTIKEIQSKTFEYDMEYKRLMKLYTEDIPALYEQSIQYNIDNVDLILADLEYVYPKK